MVVIILFVGRFDKIDVFIGRIFDLQIVWLLRESQERIEAGELGFKFRVFQPIFEFRPLFGKPGFDKLKMALAVQIIWECDISLDLGHNTAAFGRKLGKRAQNREGSGSDVVTVAPRKIHHRVQDIGDWLLLNLRSH